MNYADKIQDLIGNTPLLKLSHIDLPENVHLFAKLEFWNPGGSVKDRIGRWILESAEKSGQLKPGMKIFEATAGNTGIGIALASLNKGYEVTLAVPQKFSTEKIALMKALGATVIQTPENEGMQGATRAIATLLEKYPDAFVVNQFSNDLNPEAHFVSTGPELASQLDCQIDYLVAGAGSGGTFTGTARYLKAQIPALKAVLADPVGSTLGGGTHCASYKIEGIGNDFLPETMDMALVDDVVKVSDEEAFFGVATLAAKEGLLVGSSSGAAFHAALKTAQMLGSKGESGNIVVILPDRAERYFSKNIFVSSKSQQMKGDPL